MTNFSNMRTPKEEVNSYMNHEDFCRVFGEDQNELYQLSFLLTRDHKKAEQCFISGLEDSAKGNPVFREWARSWAKRAIIQNAIREFKPRPSGFDLGPSEIAIHHSQPSTDQGAHYDLDAVLALADFERFVFVMSVLEHYSQGECALLLGCSISEIREARTRTLEKLGDPGQMISSASVTHG